MFIEYYKVTALDVLDSGTVFGLLVLTATGMSVYVEDDKSATKRHYSFEFDIPLNESQINTVRSATSEEPVLNLSHGLPHVKDASVPYTLRAKTLGDFRYFQAHDNRYRFVIYENPAEVIVSSIITALDHIPVTEEISKAKKKYSLLTESYLSSSEAMPSLFSHLIEMREFANRGLDIKSNNDDVKLSDSFDFRTILTR